MIVMGAGGALEAFCYLCSDSRKIKCVMCGGRGLVGGFLRIGAKACTVCGGDGHEECPDCAAELGNLMRPETGPGMTQSVLAALEDLEDSRPVILPPDPAMLKAYGER